MKLMMPIVLAKRSIKNSCSSRCFPFLLALLFILKIRLGVQSNILEFIKKR